MSVPVAPVESFVDETSISPTTGPLGRRNSLEKHLTHRPEPQDLKNRHILLDTTAAPYVLYPPFTSSIYTHANTPHPYRALQAAQQELERQRITDNLKKGMEHRPDRDELVARNVLPDSNAAPALQAHQKELERHMRADSLEKKLHNRPKPDELVKGGILEADENPLKD
jgi:hypothetical protein